MNASKLIRSSEWWEYKLPPLLSIGYATLLLNNENIFENWRTILLILSSLIVGAVYVSIINDITDIKDDLAAGKANRMAGRSVLVKVAMPVICLLAGLAFLVFVYQPDSLSCIFYSIPWILFSMYSFRPVRLKNRGLGGVLADAGGSHVFTSLLMVSFVSFKTNHAVNFIWFGLTALWAVCYGLRGILWHQFHDRNNDLKSGTPTFATKIQPNNFLVIERLILLIELLAIAGILLLLKNPLLYIAAVLYGILVYIRYRKLKLFPIIIIEIRQRYQIVLLDFMQVFFPVSLLLFTAFTQPNGWIVLIAHLILFPFKTIGILNDLRNMLWH